MERNPYESPEVSSTGRARIGCYVGVIAAAIVIALMVAFVASLLAFPFPHNFDPTDRVHFSWVIYRKLPSLFVSFFIVFIALLYSGMRWLARRKGIT